MSDAAHNGGSHSMRSALRCFVLAVVVGAGILLAPVDAHGQADSAGATLPADSMTSYARTYLAISEAQIDYQFALAEVGNKTAEAQTRIKEEARERIATIMGDNGFTADSYNRWTFRVATDAQQKFEFDRRIAVLTGTPLIEGPIAPSR